MKPNKTKNINYSQERENEVRKVLSVVLTYTPRSHRCSVSDVRSSSSFVSNTARDVCVLCHELYREYAWFRFSKINWSLSRVLSSFKLRPSLPSIKAPTVAKLFNSFCKLLTREIITLLHYSSTKEIFSQFIKLFKCWNLRKKKRKI